MRAPRRRNRLGRFLWLFGFVVLPTTIGVRQAKAEELTLNTDTTVCASLESWQAIYSELGRSPPADCVRDYNQGEKVYGPIRTGNIQVRDGRTGEFFEMEFLLVKYRGRDMWVGRNRIREYEVPVAFPSLVFQTPLPSNPIFIYKGLQTADRDVLTSYELQLYNDTQGVELIQAIAHLWRVKPENSFSFECFHCLAREGCRTQVGIVSLEEAFRAAIQACPVQ